MAQTLQYRELKVLTDMAITILLAVVTTAAVALLVFLLMTVFMLTFQALEKVLLDAEEIMDIEYIDYTSELEPKDYFGIAHLSTKL